MKIAAIDLGSNSSTWWSWTRCGAGRSASSERTRRWSGWGLVRSRGEAARLRHDPGLETLRKYKRLAESAGAEKILAVATSAIPKPPTARTSWRRIGSELEIWPRTVAGDEEARLIYLAVLHSVHLEGRRALVVDIGGGSVELAVGRRQGHGVRGLREARSAAHDRGVREERSPLRQGRVAPGQTRPEDAGPASLPPALLRLRVRGGHLGHDPGRGRPRPRSARARPCRSPSIT